MSTENSVVELLHFNGDLSVFPSALVAASEEEQGSSSNDRASTLQHLERVVLSNNLIAASPRCLASCPSLRVLDLSHNRLTSFPVNLGTAAPRLEKLILNNNLLTDLRFLDGIGMSGSLQSLWIQHNEISALEATAQSLQSGCPSLRVLVMYANPCVSRGLLAHEKVFALATQLAGGNRIGKAINGQTSSLTQPQHQRQLFMQQHRGYLPMELLLLHYCSDLRGLIVISPTLDYEANTSLISSTPGANEITDGSSISAERLLSLNPRVVHRVGPAAIDIARSWYQSLAPTGYTSFIRAVIDSERELAESVLASTTSDTTSEKKGQRVRIPLAEVRAKVPSRFVEVKGGRMKNVQQDGGIPNRLLPENIETSDVSVLGRSVTPPLPPKTELPLSGNDDNENTRGAEEKNEGSDESHDVDIQSGDDHVHNKTEVAIASPTADAMSLLADVRRRTAGLLAAVSELPDVAAITSLGASGKRATASALALQQATQGGLQSGKKRDDPDTVRIIKNIPLDGNQPLLLRSPELFTIDEHGTLTALSTDTDGSCSISQEGEVKTNISDDASELTPAGSAKLRKDGSLIVRWPNGATAVEVTVDERSSLALSKWRSSLTSNEETVSTDSAVGSGGRAVSILKSAKVKTLLPSDTRCFSLSAYSRESTGKSRILSASIDGLGCGTITGMGSTTLALLQLGGSGYHTTGQGKSSPMQRSWDPSGRLSVAVGSGYADVPPPQPEEEIKTATHIPTSTTAAVAKKDPEPLNGGTSVDPSISAARAMVAAALASAEASNAAVQAIMRSRATMEKFSEPDPRKLKASEELILRKALLKIVAPDKWNFFPADYVIPKAIRSSPVLGGPAAVGFPIGQSLGIAIEIGEKGVRTFFIIITFGGVRLAIKLTLC
jgi:hypothetical protein